MHTDIEPSSVPEAFLTQDTCRQQNAGSIMQVQFPCQVGTSKDVRMYLSELPKPLQVTADLDIAIVAVSGQVVKLVNVNAVAAIGHNVKEEALVIERHGAAAWGLMIGT